MEEQELLEQFKTNAVLFDADGEQRGVMVALFPSPVVAQQLAALPGVTVPAEQLHLTLAYLGAVDTLTDTQIARTLLSVRRLAEQPFSLVGSLNGVGRFNASASSDGKDVIYAVPDVPQLVELRNTLVIMLRGDNVPVSSGHGFNPHITLAYIDPGSESPLAYIPTIPLRFTTVSLSVGGKRLDFLLTGEGLAFNTEQDSQVVAADVVEPPTTETGIAHFATNAQATAKEVTRKGRKYLVAPAVPIKEGVLNGEFVPADEIEKFALSWNGRPMPLGHPKDANGYISANNPELWDETPAFFWNATADAGALTGEIWLDIEKAQALGGLAVQAMQRLKQGLPVELSTGYFRELTQAPGEFNGKAYRGIARNLRPDHIAILLDQPGACSWQDGCGAPRVNSAQEQEQASQTFISALVRNVVRSLTPGGTKVDREAVISGLVANSACKCTREQLETMEDGTLQAFADSLKPVANTEKAEDQPIVNTEAKVEPVVVPLPQEVVAFTQLIEKFGGIDKLTATLDGLAANADKERQDLVTALVANERCTLSKEELNAFPVETLRKLQAAFAPRNYAGNAGVIVSNVNSDGEFKPLAMPTFPNKEAK